MNKLDKLTSTLLLGPGPSTVSPNVYKALSTTTITNDGSTLTVGDEATVSGGAGTGGRVSVNDISGAGVDEVIVNAAGTGYDIGDTITFSSGLPILIPIEIGNDLPCIP